MATEIPASEVNLDIKYVLTPSIVGESIESRILYSSLLKSRDCNTKFWWFVWYLSATILAIFPSE